MKKVLLSIVALVLVFGFGYQVGVRKAGFGGTVENFPVRFTEGLKAGRTEQLSIDSSGNLSTSGDLSATDDITATDDVLATDDVIATDDVTATDLLTAAKFASGSVGSSSSSPAALGAAPAGHFIIPTSGNTGNASTTAVSASSSIILQIEHTTPIAGTTCNTSATTTPVVASKVAGNGFTAQSAATPVTNPLCVAYWVIN